VGLRIMGYSNIYIQILQEKIAVLTLYVNDAILITNDLIGVLLATKDLKLKIEYNMIDMNVLAYIWGSKNHK
jgi:hypothetical protein